MNVEIVPGKVFVRIYNREFVNSTQYYLSRRRDDAEREKNHIAVLDDVNQQACVANNLCVIIETHSTDIKYVDIPWKVGDEPYGDGLFTDKPGIVLGIVTADCVPVLFSTETGSYIGGIHAGWKGTINGIIENYIDQMKKLTNETIYAVIGPSIQQDSYEVDIDYMEKFLEQSSENSKFFKKKNDVKLLFDLSGYVISRIVLAGGIVIHHFNEDTYLHPEKYPSYRYSMNNNLGKYEGEILSTIVKVE